MSTFKHNKGKLVEQPTMKKPADNEHWVATAWIAANKQYEEHLSSLRTYIAEGFSSEDEGKTFDIDKDFELVYQGYNSGYKNKQWMDCPENLYNKIDSEYRRIIARKVTKEEGEKPDEERISIELFEALEALCDMWSQYCGKEVGHMFMSAGENCADVLDKYRLLKNDNGTGGEVDYERLEQLRNRIIK